MAKVKEREELERRLARRIGKAHAAALKELLDIFGKSSGLKEPGAGDEFWDESGKALRGAIGPIMEEIYIQQAETMLEGFGGIGVDWDMVDPGSSGLGTSSCKGLSQRAEIRTSYDQGQECGGGFL